PVDCAAYRNAYLTPLVAGGSIELRQKVLENGKEHGQRVFHAAGGSGRVHDHSWRKTSNTNGYAPRSREHGRGGVHRPDAPYFFSDARYLRLGQGQGCFHCDVARAHPRTTTGNYAACAFSHRGNDRFFNDVLFIRDYGDLNVGKARFGKQLPSERARYVL